MEKHPAENVTKSRQSLEHSSENAGKDFENPINPTENVTKSTKKQGHWPGPRRDQPGKSDNSNTLSQNLGKIKGVGMSTTMEQNRLAIG